MNFIFFKIYALETLRFAHLTKTRPAQTPFNDVMDIFTSFVVTHPAGDTKVVFETLLLAAQNIAKNPGNLKFSRIPKKNKTFKWRVVDVPGATALVTAIGFEDDKERDAFVWDASCDVRQSIKVLENQLRLLNKKISNVPRKPLSGSTMPPSLSMICPAIGSPRFNVGYAESIGRRPTMEDELVILGMGPRLRENEDYFAVFDGHGGPHVAEFCAKTLHKKLRYYLTLGNDPRQSLLQSFSDTDDLLREEKVCGSTALVVFISDNKIFSANAGDSRVVLGSREEKCQRLSIDHKPSLQSEQERISMSGGTVQLVNGVWRVNGVLAVSRAFGDFFLKPHVTVEPFISETVITNDNLFVILACDGVWDVLTDEQVVNLVMSTENAERAAEVIRRTAFSRGSDDNISVIVVFLKDKKEW